MKIIIIIIIAMILLVSIIKADDIIFYNGTINTTAFLTESYGVSILDYYPNDDLSVYDDDAVASFSLVGGEGKGTKLKMIADEGDDPEDKWYMYSHFSNNQLQFINADSKVAFFDTAGALSLDTFNQVGSDPLCWDGASESYIGDCASTKEMKHNITNLNYGLDLVLQLQPRVFQWKHNNIPDVGFIAEEMDETAPLFARYRGDQAKSVKYGELTALLVNAIKEQQVMIEELQSELCSDGKEKFCNYRLESVETKINNLDLSKKSNFFRTEELNQDLLREENERLALQMEED